MKKYPGILLILFVSSSFAAKLPVITANYEAGTRFEYDLYEDEDYDYLTFDSYSFDKGYVQVSEALSKVLKFKFKWHYNLKSFEHSTNLDNNSYSYTGSLGWEIIENLKVNLGFRWNYRNYLLGDSKDLEGMAPRLEVRYTPIKYLHVGFNYSLFQYNYIANDGDYIGNRANVWYEQRIIPQINFRMRYRIENRDYAVGTALRSDSFKHSFAATVKIDLNRK